MSNIIDYFYDTLHEIKVNVVPSILPDPLQDNN